MTDEFYVGYLPRAPQGLAAFVKRVVVGLAIGLVIAAIGLVFAQNPFAKSAFEFGTYHPYRGTVFERPYPFLSTPAGQFLLVLPGKHGADAFAQTHDGSIVELTGSLIERDNQRMLEILPTRARVDGRASSGALQITQIADVVLTGEIVDSKCYLGVMNPGSGKVHRGCAARCISGGIPPAFIAKDARGTGLFMLLAGADGTRLGHEVLDFVGERVTIQGLLTRTGSTYVLRANPSLYRRAE